MASKHGTAKTTQGHTNEHMPKTNAKLQKTKHKETGSQVTYDIQKMREDPEKLKQWIQEQQKETPQDIDKAKNATQLWEEIKTTIQKGIQRNYPIQHNAKQETPEWAREAKKME